MDARTLSITFDGPAMDSGVSWEDLQKTLQHVQDAVRLTVEQLSGSEVPRRGRPSNAVRQASGLRLLGTRSGSLIAEMTLAPPTEGRLFADAIGQRALEAILNLDDDGDSNGAIPPAAVDQLRLIGTDLSSEVSSVWLGDADDTRKIRFECRGRPTRASVPTEAAVLYGWLREVNWERGTAQLHDNVGGYVALRFDAALDAEMVRLATQYVKISGAGRFNKHGDWTAVAVDSIDDTRSWNTPFDLKSLTKEAAGAAFDPEAVITTEEPFDVEDFIDAIHRERRRLDSCHRSDAQVPTGVS